ncbi:hypothetical protein NW759_012311 [Fusarium solani]|nr:hypothetical protein NW759_012311 [Fusarium solani]
MSSASISNLSRIIPRRPSTSRLRDYTRIFKACDTCRKKKTRCILDAPNAPTTACRRCKRERRQCSFTQESASPDAAIRERSDQTVAGEGETDCPIDDDEHGGGLPETLRQPLSLTSSANRTPSITTGIQPDHQRVPDEGHPQRDRIPDFKSIAPIADGAPEESDVAQQIALRAPISNDGDIMSLLQQLSRNQDNTQRWNEWETPSCSNPPRIRPACPIASSVWEPSDPSSDSLKLWNSFRFVRMGWLTAREAISYIDLFFENLSPWSPILDDFYRHHANHYSLITQEPLLCCTILMVGSRFYPLRGTSSWSRSVALHDRLWEHCQHLVTRIIFGQEKKSKAKTRTFGSIQALILMTEWAPRAVYFPPKSDGWDSDLIFQLPDDRDQPGDNEADVTQDIHGNWFRDIISPVRMIDRMSWMLLGCAVTLGHEIGIFDATKAKLAVAGLNSPDEQQKRIYSYTWLRKVIFIADEQFSSRLGSSSLVPLSLNSSAFEPLSNRSDFDVEQKRNFIDSQLALSRLAKSISNTLFSSTCATRELIQSYKYVSSIEDFQQQLLAWRQAYLCEQRLPEHTYELLAIEYQYHNVFLNSLGMQAIADRLTDAVSKTQESTDRHSPTWIQSFATTADLQFVMRVIDGCGQILQSTVRLAEKEKLRYCPTRVTRRVIAASVFLLKALGLGVKQAQLETSLDFLQGGIEALRGSTWDDLELASRYAAVLEVHVERYKHNFVKTTFQQGTEQSMTAGLDRLLANEGRDLDMVDMQAFQNPEDWLSVPWDMSMAPFGVATDESTGMIGLDDGDWSFLWNLPVIPGPEV